MRLDGGRGLLGNGAIARARAAHVPHSILSLEQEARGGCEFASFFANPDGATPHDLLQRGVYSEIAVALKGGAWRAASMSLLHTALATSTDDESDVRNLPTISFTPFSHRFSRARAHPLAGVRADGFGQREVGGRIGVPWGEGLVVFKPGREDSAFKKPVKQDVCQKVPVARDSRSGGTGLAAFAQVR